MQESTGEIYHGTKDEIKVVEDQLGEVLKPLTESDAKYLLTLPIEMRSAQSSFDNWVKTHYPDIPNDLKCKLRYAFKSGFNGAELIFNKTKQQGDK